jgi:DNA processing protein
MDAVAYWIALQRVPGLGPRGIQDLLSHYDGPEAILAHVDQIFGFNVSVIEVL